MIHLVALLSPIVNGSRWPSSPNSLMAQLRAAVLVGLSPYASLDEVRGRLAKTSIRAVITLDAEGAYARFGDDEFIMPARRIEVTDSTGAGDNFLAAFLVARGQGLSVPQALAVGNIVAGEVVQVHGAQLPINVDVPGLMQAAIQSAKNLEADGDLHTSLID